MIVHRLILWALFTGLAALLGNYAFSYMEKRLREVSSYQSKSLKWPRDFWAVYSQYRGSRSGQDLPAWPPKLFAFCTIIMVLAILYLVLMPKPFG
jgi:hypothetical protein